MRQISITARKWSAKAHLNDTIQRPKKYTDLTPQQYLEKLIAIHNAQVSDDAFKQFKVGKVTVTDTESLYRYTNYNNTLTEIKEDLLDDFGGYLFIRVVNGVKYIDYLKELPYTCDQTISFGENLLDFTRNYDASQIATALIPLGADIQEDEENSESGETAETVDQSLVNRVTIESVNNGIDFIYSEEAVKTYGWIFKTQTWDGVNKPSVLLSKARQYLSDVQWESLVIEAKAVDLHFVDGSADRFRIGSTIRVQSEPHGMDTYLPLTKQTINLASIADNSITLGNDYTVPISAQSATLDRKQQKSAAQIAADIREAEASEKTARREAIENATALITGNAGGHVVFHYSMDSDGKIKNLEEILIMDTDQIETAKKVWRWNLAGLGYSNTGYNGDYTLAMTMDGAIVADKIITGILGDKAHKNFWNMETGEFSLSAYSTTEESEKYAKEQATAAQNAAEAKAKELADSASALANAAQKEADGKITTFYQTNEPSSEMSAGDLWIDTDDGNSLHRYNGKSWDDVQDVGISKAAQAASTAQSTADKKIVTYYQSSAPSDGGLSLGDLWFDSDDNNHLYRWNGSKWVESRDGYIEEAKQSAVETAATNTENAVSDYDTNLNQEKVFNKLTNNGKAKGIYMKDSELYINADLIKSGTISADMIKGGTIDAISIKGSDINGATITGSTLEITKSGNASILVNSNGVTCTDGDGTVSVNYDGVSVKKENLSITINEYGIDLDASGTTDIFNHKAGHLYIGSTNNLFTSACSPINYKNDEGKLFTMPLADGVDQFRFVNTFGMDSKTYLELTTLYGAFGINVWSSDKFFKENITDSSIDAVSEIMRIPHYSFDWKGSGKHEKCGYIAQSMEKCNEDYVVKIPQNSEDLPKELMQIDERTLIPIITKAIQEIVERIDKIEERMEA